MLHPYLQEMYKNTFGNYDVMTVGETWGATPEIAKLYSNPARKELSMVFQFEHINLDKQEGKCKWDLKPLDPAELHRILSYWQIELGNEGWNSLFWNNHDLPRIISRWGDERPEFRKLSGKMLAIYLYFMKGIPYIYQGEEIGMINFPVDSIEEVDDTESRGMYFERLSKGYSKEELIHAINAKGRDNARHPVQWSSERNDGFSTGYPWLPISNNYLKINAQKAINDPNSLFYTYKNLIDIHKNNEIVLKGDYSIVKTPNPLFLSYTRTLNNKQILVVVNFSSKPQKCRVDSFPKEYHLLIHNDNTTKISSKKELLPYESFAIEYFI